MSTAEQAFIIWVAGHANERGHNRYTQEEKDAFMAGAKWALEDAADELPFDEADWWYQDWLRDRAAGVGGSDESG